MESIGQLANRPHEEKSFADTLHNAMRFGRALYARKIYVIASVVICCLLGAYRYSTLPRIYEASTVVMVMKAGSDYWDTSSMGPQRVDQLPTYRRLFTSDAVLKAACDRIRDDAPTIPSEWLVDFEAKSFGSWPDIIRGCLKTEAVHDTQLINLVYQSRNADGAAFVINAVVDSYLEYIETNHKDNSAKVFELLEGERESIQEQLAAKQSELLEINRSVKAFGVGTETTVQPQVQRAISLNTALIEIQQERLNQEATASAILVAVQNGQDLRQYVESLGDFPGREIVEGSLGVSSGNMASVSALEEKIFEDQSQLRSYSQYLGPGHPKVIGLSNSIANTQRHLDGIRAQASRPLTTQQQREIGRKLLSIANEKVAQAVSQENELMAKFTEAETEAIQLNDQSAKLAFANHELDRLRSMHDTLLDRMSTIEITQDRADVNVSVIKDPEASPYPVSPNRSRIASLSLFCGFGLGCVIVFALDQLEDRFRTPEEMRDQLDAPVLAVVRDMPELEGTGAEAIQVHVAPNEVESEAFRTLRTSLTFSHAGRRILAITSPEPSDGKTTVIANLAASFAQAGKRTLVIDADLRKPGLSKMFGVRGLSGLTEVLRSEEQLVPMLESLIRQTDVTSLDMLSCGPKPVDPTILLETPRLEDLLAWAESEYDQVLVDCPPIMAASDAALIGHLTNGILVVVQPAKTHRRLVTRAIENLRAFKVPIIGLVANRISAQSGDGYSGYGYGYGYGYGNGYGQDESAEDSDSVAPLREVA